MYAGRVACCPLVSHGEYAGRRTDRRTPDRYVTCSASLIMAGSGGIFNLECLFLHGVCVTVVCRELDKAAALKTSSEQKTVIDRRTSTQQCRQINRRQLRWSTHAAAWIVLTLASRTNAQRVAHGRHCLMLETETNQRMHSLLPSSSFRPLHLPLLNLSCTFSSLDPPPLTIFILIVLGCDWNTCNGLSCKLHMTMTLWASASCAAWPIVKLFVTISLSVLSASRQFSPFELHVLVSAKCYRYAKIDNKNILSNCIEK